MATRLQQREAETDGPRRVIFIMTDTQRTDMVGCYGHPDMKTPGIDSIAARGLLFERAYTCQAVCGPARSAIFTGQYPHSNGAWGNSMPLGANVRTIGQRLHDQGILAGYIGKYHLDGGDYFGLGEAAPGWDPDTWYDMRNFLEEMPDDDTRRASRDPATMLDPGVRAEDTYAWKATERAIRFLREHDTQDYLLVLSYDEPHGPSLCPEPYASMYADYDFPKSPNVWDDLGDKPGYQRVWAGDSLAEDKDRLVIRDRWLLGCNSFVDSQIARFTAAVEEFASDALVIYTSDHGDFMHSHSLWSKGPAMYDEIARIPLIISDPRDRSPRRSDQPVSHIDLMPTMLDFFGLPLPEPLEGRSLAPAIADPDVRVNDVIFTEFGRYEIDHDGFGGFRPMRGAYDGRYKLVLHLLSGDEFYDLETDPHEINNRISDPALAGERDRLHDAILDWMNRTRDPFRGYDWERRPWRSDAREASWDYTGFTRQREDSAYEKRQLDYSTGLEMVEAHRPKDPV